MSSDKDVLSHLYHLFLCLFSLGLAVGAQMRSVLYQILSCPFLLKALGEVKQQ